MKLQAVILGGGRGTRLGPLTATTPKPLLEIAGRPFVVHLLEELARFGFEDVVLLVGPFEAAYRRLLGDGADLELKLTFLPEPFPAGTAGALRFAEDRLSPSFLLLNGDSWFDVNYLDLVSAADGTDGIGTIALRAVADVARYGRVTLDGERIVGFAEKAAAGPGAINAGAYWLSRRVFDWIGEPPVSLENDVLPVLAARGLLRGRVHEGRFIDIGTPESFAEAQRVLADWRRRPAAFLDRDGVINVDIGYLHRPEDCRWIEGAVEAIRRLNDLGYLVVVVTNQAGVARGYYGEADVQRLHDWMNRQFRAAGAHVDAFYYCPCHPEGTVPAYSRKSDRRKPAPGMILEAIRDWRIDTAASFLIGDKDSDLEAARRAGIPGYLFTGEGLGALVEEALGEAGRGA